MPDLRASLAVLALTTTLPLVIVPSAHASAPDDTMVVAALPGLPGYPDHHVTGVNDLGQIVGSAQGNGPAHAVMWSPRGGATGLGPGLATAINQRGQVLGVDSSTGLKPWVWFGGTRRTIAPPTAVRALAYVINESGDVPMTYSRSTLGQYDRAAVWEDGRHTELPLTGAYVSLEAINDAGVVVGGHSSFETQEFTAIRCLDGDCVKLAGVQTGYGPYGPEAINEAGVVVGNRGTVALRWEGDEVTVLSENGRVAHGAQALNERGDAVGWSVDADGFRRAVLWPADRKEIDLGVPTPSEAIAVNERGDVVGFTSDGSTRAFLWRAGRVTYLDSLGGSYSAAVAINNHGVVVGQSTTADGTAKAVRWAPATSDPLR
jgi:probable HAF family extracellular repeat protein